MKKFTMMMFVMGLVSMSSALAQSAAPMDLKEIVGIPVGLHEGGAAPAKTEAGAYVGRCYATPGRPSMGFVETPAVLIILKMKPGTTHGDPGKTHHMMSVYLPNAGLIPYDAYDQKTATEVLAETKKANLGFYEIYEDGKDQVCVLGERPLKYTLRENQGYLTVKGDLTETVGEMLPGPMMYCSFFKKLPLK